MEVLKTVNNDVDGRFDDVIAKSRKQGICECGDMEIVFKGSAMESGNGAVLVTFTVCDRDGSNKRRVQAVTTAANFINAGVIVDAWEKQHKQDRN